MTGGVRWSLGLVAHGLEVVAVRVVNVGGVIGLVVVRTQAGRAVVLPARGRRGREEGIDRRAIARGESDVRRPALGARADPEVGDAPAGAEAGCARELHLHGVAEWLQRLFVEALGALEVGDVRSDVV